LGWDGNASEDEISCNLFYWRKGVRADDEHQSSSKPTDEVDNQILCWRANCRDAEEISHYTPVRRFRSTDVELSTGHQTAKMYHPALVVGRSGD
jgi:hypothetical protein